MRKFDIEAFAYDAMYSKKQVADFDLLSVEDCVTRHEGKDGYVAAMWQPIIDLDKCMAKAREVELIANGIQPGVIAAPNYPTSCVRKRADAEYADFNTMASLNITAILNQYKQWKTKRERLLTGRPGAFFDFEESTNKVVACICILSGLSTYSDLALKLNELIMGWSSENNTCDDLLSKYHKQVVSLSENNFERTLKETAFIDLSRSKAFNIKELSFVAYKLWDIVRVEQDISALKLKYFI